MAPSDRHEAHGAANVAHGWKLRLDPSWVREIQRDVLALGSTVFYLLVLGRSLIGPFWDLVVPLVVVGVVLLAATPWLRSTDLYLTRGVVVAVLVTQHYGDPVFGAFAAVAVVAVASFAIRLGHPRAAVGRGLGLGVVLSVVGAVLAWWIA